MPAAYTWKDEATAKDVAGSYCAMSIFEPMFVAVGVFNCIIGFFACWAAMWVLKRRYEGEKIVIKFLKLP
jgi:hypothetical protein